MPGFRFALRAVVTALPLVSLVACGAADEAPGSAAQAETVAARPPMGWNSWNQFGCDVSEPLVRQMADALVTSGMRDLGYVYVNLDDCWMATTRDAAGNLQANPQTFPSGIKALADDLHARGLKLGIYESPGPQTCVARSVDALQYPKHPGSEGHEQQDADTFAAWGVDYLKYDRCTATKEEAEARFALMGDALKRTGRPIVYSINPDGATATKPWSTYANLWRTTPDIAPAWTTPWWAFGTFAGVTPIVDLNAPLAGQASPGHWNDPDMLEVGVTKKIALASLTLTDAEARAHFSMWAMMAAPLIAGNDLRAMSPATRETLTNAEVIAVDQDAAGVQGARVKKQGNAEVWSKRLAGGGTRAVALFNRGGSAVSITASWSDLGLRAGKAAVRNLWTHADEGAKDGAYTAVVPAHGVVLVKVVGEDA